MLSPLEFAAAWGKDRYRFPSHVLQNIDTPEASKSFLLEAGLPEQAEVPSGKYAVPLPIVPASPPVQAAKYALMALFPSSQLRLLAYLHDEQDEAYWGYDLYYAIEEKTGHVRYLEPREEGEGFVNVSVVQFAEFLLVYRQFIAQFWPTYPERSKILPLVTALEQKWQEIDPLAMADPDNYWAIMLYDLEWQL